MSDDKKPEPKKYSLKKVESTMLQVMINQHQALLSNFISFIAMERLAYPVTEQTNFQLANDLSAIEISEPEEDKKGKKNATKA